MLPWKMLDEEGVNQVLEKLSLRFPEAGVYLYGSYSRGEQKESSDLDVLLVFDEFRPGLLDEIGNFRRDMQYKVPIELSLRPVTTKTFVHSDTPFWRTIRRSSKLFHSV